MERIILTFEDRVTRALVDLAEAARRAAAGMKDADPVAAYGLPVPFMVPRSGKWPRLERIHLSLHPECAVCGSTEGCVGHHVKPVHLFPDEELDPDNVVTLCNPRWHHILFGHLMIWKSYNINVRQDAERFRRMIEARPSAAPEVYKTVGAEALNAVMIESERKCAALFAQHPEVL